MQHQDNNKISSSLEATLLKARENAKSKGLFLTDDDIEAYARGDLDKETTAILEMRMTQDLEFAAEVNAEMALADGIRQYAKAHQVEMQRLKEIPTAQAAEIIPASGAKEAGAMTLSTSNVPVTATTPVVVSSNNNWQNWLIAAAIALFCGVFWLIQLKNPEAMLAELKEQEMADFTRLNINLGSKQFGGSESNVPSNFENAAWLFNQGKFQETEDFILKIEGEQVYELRYILGMCALFQDDYDRALTHFQPNIDDKEGDKADYYVKSIYGAALCHLAKRDKAKVRELLDILITMAPDKNFEYKEKSLYIEKNM